MFAVVIIKNNERPVRTDKTITRGVVRRPQLHVRRVCGITNVERVVQQSGGDIAGAQRFLHAPQPPSAHRVHVGQPQPQRPPFRQRLLAGAERVHV